MSTQDQNEVRDIAKTIVQRAITDAAFGEQLRSDPRSTLLDAGMPEQYVDDFIANDLSMEAEVSGYGQCSMTCIFITCDQTF